MKAKRKRHRKNCKGWCCHSQWKARMKILVGKPVRKPLSTIREIQKHPVLAELILPDY